MSGLDDSPDLFAVPDLWHTSEWLDQFKDDASKPFFASTLKGTTHLSISLSDQY